MGSVKYVSSWRISACIGGFILAIISIVWVRIRSIWSAIYHDTDSGESVWDWMCRPLAMVGHSPAETLRVIWALAFMAVLVMGVVMVLVYA
jgi:hypothetical protein